MPQLKTIWVGKDRKEAKRKEKQAMRKYGDAIMSSGLVTIKGKNVYGYAVSIPTNMNKNSKVKLFNELP